MSFLAGKPDAFQAGAFKLSTKDLNQIMRLCLRQIRGIGPISVDYFGDRVTIGIKDERPRLPDVTNYVAQYRVLEEFDDCLLCEVCVPPNNETDLTSEMYEAEPIIESIGGQVWVTKPFWLQRTPWDGQAIDFFGQPGVFSYTGLGERTATLEDETTVDQVITPSYVPGDIIFAAKLSTGILVADTDQPIAWTDINTAGRTWETLGSGGISGSGTFSYLPQWTPDGNTLGDSYLSQNSSEPIVRMDDDVGWGWSIGSDFSGVSGVIDDFDLGYGVIHHITIDDDATITGFAPILPFTGQPLILVFDCVVAKTLTLAHDTGSSSGGRLFLPGNVDLTINLNNSSATVIFHGAAWVPGWVLASAVSTAAGADTQVQFNDGGNLGAVDRFKWSKTTNTLSILDSTLVAYFEMSASSAPDNGFLLHSHTVGAFDEDMYAELILSTGTFRITALINNVNIQAKYSVVDDGGNERVGATGTNALGMAFWGGICTSVGAAAIDTVGTLISGATGSGFTVDLSSSTVSGTLVAANMETVGPGAGTYTVGLRLTPVSGTDGTITIDNQGRITAITQAT